MKKQNQTARILSTIIAAGVLLASPLFGQQSSQPPQPTQPQQQTQPAADQPVQNTAPVNPAPANTQPASPAPGAQQPQQGANPSGTTVNPSQAPLQPVTTYPDAAGAQQDQQPASGAQNPAQANVPNGPQPKRPSEPVGAAAAEGVPTSGGAAAKPAGVAIAPAKQHQTRSLLIKIGAALAAGAAVGTVFALSHGTSSVPPGATAPGVTQR